MNEWMSWNSLDAGPLERLPKLLGSSQHTVTPVKFLLFCTPAIQCWAMYPVFITASLTFSFTVILALLILSCTVVWDMIVSFGCRSWTRLWNAGCSTSTKGWQPWTRKLNTALSTHFWDSCFASWSFILWKMCQSLTFSCRRLTDFHVSSNRCTI